MPSRFQLPFHPIASTAPSFEATFDNTSTSLALQSTSLREWAGPTNRSVRLATRTADDYLVAFGTSDITLGGSSDAMLVLGGTVEVFHPILPSHTHIAMQSSTDVTANVTLGYGA
ncbi:MAG TPA: hypothetical protein ENH55_13365 [Aurantimonas coralicida]|uniref:Uncharacterized protein n=2 Tax=root TaxID=1 RepID=A0A9C9NDT6_9HYPH|nr:hypothetical protein [Aurantimonas coralicida]HET99650.1 hypothetical protein [Aurantimonas coralicida]